LTTQLPNALSSQSVSAQIGKIARAMPLDTTQAAQEQRIRRLLDNERITQEDHYQPLAKRALHGLKGQNVQLQIDRILLRDTHTILVVSIGFRRRSLPLAWLALLLPERVRVSIHGDREFRSQELFAWVRELGHDSRLGVPGRTLLARTPDGDATARSTWLPNRDTVA
jgi:transcriptional regulator of met regulon